MPTFLLISRHSPENCPMFSEKARKVSMQLVNKQEELMKKHGIKLVGFWQVPTEHLMFQVYEVPSLEAFQKFGREPEIQAWYAYNTVEMKSVISIEEATQRLLQAK